MSKLTLTPEEASELLDLAVGSTSQVHVELKVTKNDESGFEADIVSAEPMDSESPEEYAAEGESSDMPMAGDKPKNPALMIMIGKGKK